MSELTTAVQAWRSYIEQKQNEFVFWQLAIDDLHGYAHTAELRKLLNHYQQMLGKTYSTIIWAQYKLERAKKKAERQKKGRKMSTF
jgi:hypothetical protein